MVESQSEVLSADLGPISLRTIEGDAERNAFFRLAAATFAGGETAEMVEAWRALMLDGPNASRFHLIGAFRDGAYLGGHAMDERTIRIGKAKLRCGFIGAVVTHPDFRRQGVAGDLMRGSLDLAVDQLHVRWSLTQQPRAGWMARIVDLPGTVDALQPAWNARWRQANLERTSTLSLAIDGDAWLLTLGPEGIEVTRGTTTAETLYLSLRQWTQVIFGFRPFTWVVAQQEDPVPADLLQAFEALFPPIEPWIAPLDGF